MLDEIFDIQFEAKKQVIEDWLIVGFLINTENTKHPFPLIRIHPTVYINQPCIKMRVEGKHKISFTIRLDPSQKTLMKDFWKVLPIITKFVNQDVSMPYGSLYTSEATSDELDTIERFSEKYKEYFVKDFNVIRGVY